MKNKLCLSVLFSFMLGSMNLSAEAPEGYYDDCEGKSQSALKTQLYYLVKDHTRLTYSSGTWPAFVYTDVTDDGRYWIDIYTHENVSVSGHNGMNIEHSFPKSWWNNNKKTDYAWCDIVHLMPVNEWANNDRSNHPYAEVAAGGEKAPNYRCPSPNYKLGAPAAGMGGGASTVFEPADEYKGDLARTYFYMVTCYQNLTWSQQGLYTLKQGDYPTLQPWAMEMLLRWHRQDPVSEKERKRNDGIYSQQHNRNPFIDHPEMVEHIWGNLQDTPWHDGQITPPEPPVSDDPRIIAPEHESVFYFVSEQAGDEQVQQISVLAEGLTHSLVAKISGPDADMFSIMMGSSALSALTINAADAVSSKGYVLDVRYLPQIPSGSAPHAATLTISGRDLEQPVEVRLDGECKTSTIQLPTLEPAEGAVFFTLDGRRLDRRPTSPGIYIMVSGNETSKFIAR